MACLSWISSESSVSGASALPESPESSYGGAPGLVWDSDPCRVPDEATLAFRHGCEPRRDPSSSCLATIPPCLRSAPTSPVLRGFNVSTCLVSVVITLSPTVSPWELCGADGRSKKPQLFLVPGFTFSCLDIGIGDGEMLFRSQIRGILIHKQKGAALFEVSLRHTSYWGNT